MSTFDDLLYNPFTGDLIWKRTTGSRAVKGTIAGSINKNGYVRIKVQGKSYFAHIIIWERFYGEIPNGIEIDHKDGVPSNNRLSNLRLGTRSENMMNQRRQRTSLTGVKGVGFDKKSGLYRARIKTNGETVCKMFSDIEEAKNWICEERKSLHKQFANNG